MCQCVYLLENSLTLSTAFRDKSSATSTLYYGKNESGQDRPGASVITSLFLTDKSLLK